MQPSLMLPFPIGSPVCCLDYYKKNYKNATALRTSGLHTTSHLMALAQRRNSLCKEDELIGFCIYLHSITDSLPDKLLLSVLHAAGARKARRVTSWFNAGFVCRRMRALFNENATCVTNALLDRMPRFEEKQGTEEDEKNVPSALILERAAGHMACAMCAACSCRSIVLRRMSTAASGC